jgi:hypothetical protein
MSHDDDAGWKLDPDVLGYFNQRRITHRRGLMWGRRCGRVALAIWDDCAMCLKSYASPRTPQVGQW